MKLELSEWRHNKSSHLFFPMIRKRCFLINILLIDDNKNCLEAMETSLEMCGYSCVPFYDPVEAVESLYSNYYDVAVTDYIMPKLSGIKVAEKIRVLHPETKIILVSGLLEEHDLRIASSNIADAYFCKPLKIVDILSVIESVVCKISQVM